MKRLLCRHPFEPWCCGACGIPQDRPHPSSMRGLVCGACIDEGRWGEPFVPLTIRLLQGGAKPDPRPILAVSMADQLCAIEDGDVFDLSELPERVRERRPGEPGAVRFAPDQLPPSIVIVDRPLDLLAYLDQGAAARSIFWQWQVSIRAFTAWRPEARSTIQREILHARPIRFGYASRRGKRRRAEGRARWYLVVDPAAFIERPPPELGELLRFGVELRQWSGRERLPIAATVSGYGSRLLRDARFGGSWRRKVPASTNAHARRHLPGNHYQLLTATDRPLRVVHKWDQRGAHHHAALVSRFPHPDLLTAHGWYRRPAPQSGAPLGEGGAIWAGTARHRELLDQAGLFTLAVHSTPELAADPLALPALRHRGTCWRTVTSAEIAHMRRLPGVRLGDIWACWTSPEDDARLSEYALWSQRQLSLASQSERRWLKPLLLAAYGMLALRPSRFRTGWRWTRARHQGAVGWGTGHGHLVGFERRGERERESATVNVIWRAIIESRVRLESLTFAQLLRDGGMRPIAIYADAVFATGPQDACVGLFTTPPWRYEGTIHDLTFDAPSRYRSREETRLPGSPRQRAGLSRPTSHSTPRANREGVRNDHD